jgi:hypothetical protein
MGMAEVEKRAKRMTRRRRAAKTSISPQVDPIPFRGARIAFSRVAALNAPPTHTIPATAQCTMRSEVPPAPGGGSVSAARSYLTLKNRCRSDRRRCCSVLIGD